MKTLLIIGYVWPEPKSSAAGSRMMELIHFFLAQQWKIIFASAAALSDHRADLACLGIQEKSIALNDSSFNDFIADLKPHAVLFDRFFTEEQFGWRVEQVCPTALRLLDTEDLHSLRHARHQLLKQSQKNIDSEVARQSVNPVLANAAELYETMANDDMAQREVAAIFRCDLSLMISTFEIELLINYFSVPPQLLHYCPFLTVRKAQALPDFNERQHFISIGNFRHEPNWDAVLYLKHAIWPLIRAQLPQAELHVYGSYPPPKATQLHNPKQGFHIKGWADDAFDVMKNARVCLAPLRFGAGIKGKLMDAMQCGTPSLTTAIGAEAMHDGTPWGGAIQNDLENLAVAAIKLYTDQSEWQKAQDCGLNNLENYFLNKDYAQELKDRFESLEENYELERQQNFIGSMLRHHSLKSTQYMSQWIEAKNK
ncbi:glycosyl transferase [Cellvibrio zantedeschiae]|uniref:Glycosyl transferase n=1 Tax=Cellvibrio zantedeschiae TaxID=1237077 RepID=A0ABQ3B6J1_9GAMM|nr:glycosyltransferase family 4 protein [Cellvibrio zantedeschiae]GGY77353.1 glycosyl transferase [Cellvibrio zantedeschiae]